MDAELQKLVDAVCSVGNIVRDAWTKPTHVRHKGAIDLVTETDLAVEARLKEILPPLMPKAGFMAEESTANIREPESDCWIIDPVDGTTNFVHRIPQVATSVALWSNGRAEMGVVNLPMLGECFAARRGHGAFLNGKPIHVSQVDSMTDALLATGFPYDISENLEQILKWLSSVLPASQGLRRIGAASVDLAYVACGRFEAFYEMNLKPWDYAAGMLIVEEAGGKVTDVAGQELHFGRPLLASNGKLHKEMLQLLTCGN